MSRLRKCDFEVFGRVQGNEYARKLGLVGWIKNTENNTVCGTFEGSEESVNLL
ncbi:acylphosphatase [Clonorchis sinensis]|uniref:acylphosphatase n=1 Tax=Clonorchis sinensis TaxID=79923 RepID=G7Y5R3_CLOSI|nr:acylphosphatase [Clonorchis sinensis]